MHLRRWKPIITNLLREYPLPFLTFIGLFSGIIAFTFKNHTVAHYIWFATLVLGGAPVVLSTIKGMLKGHFASDIVAMLAIITAIIMNQAFAGAVVVLMQSGGEALEKFGLRRASSSLNALLGRAPRSARRKKDDHFEEIDVKEVKVGDVLLVRQGDLIPVDGTIVMGEAEIDESAMTGEPLSHLKKLGAHVVSGSIDTNGAFEMRADKISEESQYAKIVQLVRQAQEEKAPIQRLADRYAIYFTPLAILISLLGWAITQDATTLLSVLVVATPCPLILATPVAVISGINRAAEAGIIVKGGAPLEDVSDITAAVFDKTGTITHGSAFIDEIICFDHIPGEKLLFKAACLEQLSSHSVALSIARQEEKKFGKLPFPSDFHETPGRGVEGVIEGERIFVGSQSFIEEKLGSKIPPEHAKKVDLARTQGKLIVFLAIDQEFAGIIVLSDRIRDNVPSMISRLRKLGVKKILLLTGDNAKNAEVVAGQAGITEFKADLMPEGKVKAVQELMKTHSSTLMVGDGINDAPALATATVGIAMGAQGTAISAEAANIVLLVDDVAKVAETVFIGQRMVRIAKQSIFVGMGLSLLLMCIAAFGYIQPAIGALLQEVIDAAVIINALRAR